MCYATRWRSTRSISAACTSAPPGGKCTCRPTPATAGRPSSGIFRPWCPSRSRHCHDPNHAAATSAQARASRRRGEARRRGPGHAALGARRARGPLSDVARDDPRPRDATAPSLRAVFRLRGGSVPRTAGRAAARAGRDGRRAFHDRRGDCRRLGQVTVGTITMLTKILIALAVIVVAVVVVVALQPAEFRVARSATISAPAPAVFAQVNDFHNWEAWSPWAKLDPAAKATFEGPSAGIGAIFRWAGNNEVGEGSMTITESRPSGLIRIKLEFLKPFAATNTAEFTFKPAGNQTAVTWTMEGRNNFIAKAVCLFMNMEKMVGGQFRSEEH